MHGPRSTPPPPTTHRPLLTPPCLSLYPLSISTTPTLKNSWAAHARPGARSKWKTTGSKRAFWIESSPRVRASSLSLPIKSSRRLEPRTGSRVTAWLAFPRSSQSSCGPKGSPFSAPLSNTLVNFGPMTITTFGTCTHIYVVPPILMHVRINK